MANQAGLNQILKMAINSMTEDNTTETDLSSRSVQDLQWLKEAIEAGAAGADVDVKEMLGALKNAAAGEHVGENLEYVAEFCEDLNFAEVAVNNRGIGICIQNLGSKEASHRKGAATLISAISQNYPKIQKKTIHLLPLLLKIANDENDQNALRAELGAISAVSRMNMESIAKFFELNGQALINSILLSEDSSERVLHKLLFFTTRLVEECELTNSDFPEAKSGLKRAQVLEKLTFIRKSLENIKTDHPEVQENRKILLDIIPK